MMGVRVIALFRVILRSLHILRAIRVSHVFSFPLMDVQILLQVFPGSPPGFPSP